MEGKKSRPATFEDYLAQFPPDVQHILLKVRAAIKAAAPKAEEKISYNMPAFVQNGDLIWFSAWKKHVALYPRVSGDEEALDKELAAYYGTKGSFHFPLDRSIPYDLIGEIVRLRLVENQKNSER